MTGGLGRLCSTAVDVFLFAVAAKLFVEVVFVLLSAVLRRTSCILFLEVVCLC